MSFTASVHRLVAARPWPARSVAARGGLSWSTWLVDVAVAATALAGSLALVAHRGFGAAQAQVGDLDPIRVVLVTLATVPLLAWRRAPLSVFALTVVASVLLAAAGQVIWPPLGPAAALYLVASSRNRTTPWTARNTAVVIFLLLAYLGAAAAAAGYAGGELAHAALAWAVAWFAGERTRLRREQIAELRERAALAEQYATHERQLAVAEERARIARDLHDSAGHALNVIAVRAGAARLRHDRDPGRSVNALSAIEDIARQTVADIDQFIGTLRAEHTCTDVVERPPGLASLDSLIAQHAAAGLHVTVARSGTARPVATAVDQAVYRILQEALTNAARHGAGTAHGEIVFGEAALDITVTNPIRPGRPATATRGHGLIGMRERATLLGGTLTVEQGDCTFRINTRIPYAGRRP